MNQALVPDLKSQIERSLAAEVFVEDYGQVVLGFESRGACEHVVLALATVV